MWYIFLNSASTLDISILDFFILDISISLFMIFTIKSDNHDKWRKPSACFSV